MNDQQLQLWNDIKRFELDDPEISSSFTDRLARENGWTMDYSIRAIVEYKKFMFLLTLNLLNAWNNTDFSFYTNF